MNPSTPSGCQVHGYSCKANCVPAIPSDSQSGPSDKASGMEPCKWCLDPGRYQVEHPDCFRHVMEYKKENAKLLREKEELIEERDWAQAQLQKSWEEHDPAILKLVREKEELIGALELLKKTLSASVSDYEQNTGLACGAIDNDNYELWKSEIKMIDDVLARIKGEGE